MLAVVYDSAIVNTGRAPQLWHTLWRFNCFMTAPKTGTETEDTSNGGGAGGGTGGGGNDPKGDLTPDAVKKFMRQFRSPSQAVEKLMRDNRKYRRKFRGEADVQVDGKAAYEEEIAELEDTVRRLQEHTIPDGYVAVPSADAKELAEFRKLGDLKKVKAGMEKLPTLEQEKLDRDAEKADASAAEKVGYNAVALTKLRASEKFVIEERDVEVTAPDGTKSTKKMPYARVAADDKAEWLPLDKFAEKHLSVFLPSLLAPAGDGTTNHNGNSGGTPREGLQIPRQQSSTGSAPSTDAVATYTGTKYVRPSERNKAKT